MGDPECLRQGVTDWIPAESAEIGTVKQLGAPSRYELDEACGEYICNFLVDQGGRAWIRKFKKYQFASVYQKVKENLNRMESKRLRIHCRRNLRRSRIHQKCAQKKKMEIDAMKRVDTVDTTEERVQSRHKKKWKKGKRGNYRKRNERKMRESQQKERDEKRKCRRISKYAACY